MMENSPPQKKYPAVSHYNLPHPNFGNTMFTMFVQSKQLAKEDGVGCPCILDSSMVSKGPRSRCRQIKTREPTADVVKNVSATILFMNASKTFLVMVYAQVLVNIVT